ncbi:MAG: cell division protein FtsQ/DivIB [Hahellaceae bacterium]|nr:cell division protein FtsQ/DivIB [Hahellaceae bacterium]
MEQLRKRSQKVAAQRGASPLRDGRNEGPAPRPEWIDAVLALPWRSVAIHLGLFSFWLVVLGGGATLLALADRKVGEVAVTSELVNLPVERVKQRLLPYQGMSFFGISLGELRREIQKEAWVADVSLHRKWPDIIEIQVEERVPVVRWGRDGLLTAEGTLFVPEQPWTAAGLPQLEGPEGSTLRVYEQFQQWQPAVASIGLHLVALSLDDRGAWSLDMADGWRLTLGKNDVEARFNRFLVSYPKIRAAREELIERIDMRYSSGMAVRWKPLEEAEKPGVRSAG